MLQASRMELSPRINAQRRKRDNPAGELARGLTREMDASRRSIIDRDFKSNLLCPQGAVLNLWH